MAIPDRPLVGVLLPTREAAMTGDFTMAPLLDFAREAEDLGFDALWTGDSLTARPRLDPFVVLAGVAAVTRRIALGTAALTPALRHPLVGVSLVAALDQACGGRLVLGLGSGFPIPDSEAEFAALGVPFEGRAGRLDELVAMWRATWRGDLADGGTFTGRRYQVSGLDRLARPVAAEGPPLWLAGSDTPAVLRRVARGYDGWLPFLPTAEAYAAGWATIRQLAAKAGRPDGAIQPALYATVNVNDDVEAAERDLEGYVQSYYGYPLALIRYVQAYGYGSGETCAAWLAGYFEAGARHVVLRIGSVRSREQLRRVARLLPALRTWRPTGPSSGSTSGPRELVSPAGALTTSTTPSTSLEA